MASMDVTPQELRDVEIREAWRGYHRDDVDELLERAAATIEHLEEQVRAAQARAAQAPASPPPARVPAVQTPATPPPVPARNVAADTDVIQRTLVLAQKAADEAVAEARAHAQQLVAESESKAQALVSEAEANARRIADTERRRLEEEIGQLTSARDTLNADVDALERFEAEFRTRLRDAISAELDSLEATGQGRRERPSLHNVSLPAPRSWTPSTSDTWSGGGEGVTPVALPSAGQPTVNIQAVSAQDQWGADPDSWSEPPSAAVVDDSQEHNVEHGDSLDDDAFFASLREAVRDDTPLEQRETTSENFLGEGDEPDDQRKLFRRRR
jgi:DivIVA domain-containing protein